MPVPQPLIADRYRLIQMLGSGGMGRVWLARDELLHRDVAIKEVIPPPGLTDAEREELGRRTLREARTAARLNHPNVVRIYDVLPTEPRPWIVMEYLPARSLQQVINEEGPLAPTRVAAVGLSVLAALQAAHGAGVVHRDVKPSNVLLAADGRVVLTDFGLATFEGGDGTLTRPGLVLGSPQYVAPERARDGTSSAESDLWSLGALLYAAVEGRSPYARSTTWATLTALATEDPAPPKRAAGLKPVLNALLRKNPQARAGYAEVERLLGRAAAGESRRWWSRRRRQGEDAPRGERSAAPAAVEMTEVDNESDLPPAVPGRRRWLIAVAVAAILVVLAAILTDELPGGSARTQATPISAVPEPSLATSAFPAAPTSATTAQPSPMPSPAGGGAGNPVFRLLPGWHYYQDRTVRWRIAVPDGWVPNVDPNDRSITYFNEPGTPHRRLGVDWTDHPKPDAYQDWLTAERVRVSAGDFPNYRRIRLERVKCPFQQCVDWEYTYTDSGTRLHVLNRNIVVSATRAHAIFWLTPDSVWQASHTMLNQALASFDPGPLV
jgi:eukaryotic-like serine/threonine-protein kinase